MRSSVKVVVLVGALLAVGAGIAFVATRGGGDADEGTEAGRTMIGAMAQDDPKGADELRKKAARLKSLLESKRLEAERRKQERLEPRRDERGGLGLSPAEESALKGLLDKAYDLGTIERVLEDGELGAAGAYSRELNEAFGDLTALTALEGENGRIEVTPASRAALERMNTVKTYALNLMHAHRPGDPARQLQAITRVNDQFRERIGELNKEYPFLDVRMLEP